MKRVKTEKVYTYELSEQEADKLIQYNLEHKKGIIAELEAIEGVEEIDIWITRSPAVLQIKVNTEHANASDLVEVFLRNIFKGAKRERNNKLSAPRKYRKSA